MRITTRKILSFALGLAVATAFAPAKAVAQYSDPNGGGAPYGDDSVISQTVARISYVDGEASYSRGDDPDNWQPAALNVPMTLGDRVYTGERSRMELQVQGGAFVRMAPDTDLTALNMTDDIKQLSLTSGTATFRVRRLRRDEVFEVDTPNVAVTFETPGYYRIDVDADGNSHVVVRSGEITVAAEGGQIPVSSGNEISIQGFDNPSYDVTPAGRRDSWDQWVAFRDSRFRRTRSYAYVNANVVGAEDLDQYGRWEDVPQYGRCWTPSTVAADWAPYREGQWIWQDPWGWTWVGAEPWGWAPYHYGRWVNASSRWYWVPASRQTVAVYSPALVAFVGGGPGWSASLSIGGGGGYVGWFPLAPRDPFIPWWGDRRGRDVNVNVTNVTYVNRTYVTVVNQNTFVSGGVVNRNIVRDAQVVRQVTSAPVQRGAIPVVPTMASIRVASAAATARTAPRPSAAIAARAVVTRVAPPAAPATFDRKMRVIQENRGAPVAPGAGARLAIEARGARAAAPVRPASVAPTGGGRVGLTPRREAAGNVRVQAVTAPKGKALATSQRPLVAAPSAASTPNAPAPARVAPGAVAPAPTEQGRPGNRPGNRPENPSAPGRPEAPAATPPGRPAPPAPAKEAPESWRERPAPAPQAAPPPPTTAPEALPPGQQRRLDRSRPTPPPDRATPPADGATPPPDRATPPPNRETSTPIPPDRRPPNDRRRPQDERGRPAPDQATPPPTRPNGRPDQVPADRRGTPEANPPRRDATVPPADRRGTPETNPPRREATPPNRETPRPPNRDVPPPPARVDENRPGRGQAVRPPTPEERKAAADKKKKDKDKDKEAPPPPPPSL